MHELDNPYQIQPLDGPQLPGSNGLEAGQTSDLDQEQVLDTVTTEHGRYRVVQDQFGNVYRHWSSGERGTISMGEAAAASMQPDEQLLTYATREDGGHLVEAMNGDHYTIERDGTRWKSFNAVLQREFRGPDDKSGKYVSGA